MSDLTEIDSDNLADIIWWIKGYRAAHVDHDESCLFGAEHIESLRKFRLAFRTQNVPQTAVPSNVNK